jgi:hypothetical protein
MVSRSLVLGFLGRDKTVVSDIISGKNSFNGSKNSWDWLGHGSYFWENSPL